MKSRRSWMILLPPAVLIGLPIVFTGALWLSRLVLACVWASDEMLMCMWTFYTVLLFDVPPVEHVPAVAEPSPFGP